ncbi:hypothetical protein NUACC26_072330 [Scytonema sp. NUACC26]
MIRDLSAIAATTFGTGNAGKISVRAKGDISISNGSILSGVAPGAVGDSGTIDLQSRSFLLTSGSVVQTQTLGRGNAGNIRVQVADSFLSRDNAQIRGSVEPGATGNGGEIKIGARSLSLSNGAQVVTSTAGSGKAGDITLNVLEDIFLSGKNTGLLASTKASVSTSNRVAAKEDGEAGSLLDSAQDLSTQPGTIITSISGKLSNDNDVDLYKIFLAGDRTFSATTIGGTEVDTRLFLFDASGRGIYGNDAGGRSPQSTLPANDLLTPSNSGVYYLAISSSDNLPYSDRGNIFNNGAGVLAPLLDAEGYRPVQPSC